MVGLKLKSKINGNLFFIENLIEECGKQYYAIRDIALDKVFYTGKEWFENGIMQNLEII